MSVPRSGTYAVSSGDLVKIGKSSQIMKRIRAIQCHSPVPVTLIGTSPTDIEAELHRQLRDHHVYGEWFSLPAVVDVLRQRLDSQCVEVMPMVTKAKPPAIANRMKTHCKRGHELIPENCAPYATRQGYRVCAICIRLNEKEYRKKNRNRINAKARARRRWDPEKVNATERAWYAANIERQRALNREKAKQRRARLTEEQRARERAMRARWRESNREKINQKHAQWTADNRAAVREYQRKYRRRKRAGAVSNRKQLDLVP